MGLPTMRLRTARDIGALLRERRRQLGLTQTALAERVGVSRLWVSEMEQGKARAELGLVLRALEAVGVRLLVDERPDDGVAVLDIDQIVERARKR
jgi:HTH-type transcriptional regulator/antitoxin HipB